MDGDHCAFGDTDLIGLTEQEIDSQCNELFKTAPMEFEPRQNNEMDMSIDILVKELGVTIPILHIKDKLYLVGPKRMTMDIKRDELMLRVGGGFERFTEYIPANHKYFERCLVVHMIKSQESLEKVVELLYQGKKVPNLIK